MSFISITIKAVGLAKDAFSQKNFEHFFKNKIEATGGLVLDTLGLKILIQHLLL
jgi:putative Mn2+ efflux pump MntP